MKFKAIAKFVGISFTIFICLLYLISCLTSYISPERFPLLTILSIGFLITLPVYFLTAIAWLFVKRKVGVLLLLLSLCGYRNIASTIAVNFSSNTSASKEINSLRILSWNVNEFGDNLVISDTPGSKRRSMLAFIRETDPDILCLQDITENFGSPEYVTNFKSLLDAHHFSGYHYAYFERFRSGNFSQQYGVAIFSKLPVVDTGSIRLSGLSEERAGYIDLMYNSKKLRVLNAHLTSMSLWPSDNAGVDYIKGDSSTLRVKGVFSKVKHFGKTHAKEAKVLRAFMDTTNVPLIFSGDLNSVPSSYVHQHIKGNMKDVFLEKGYLFGGTYNRLFPKIRIDVVFHSPELQVVNYYRPVLNYSDHCPIIADLKWKE